MKTAFRLVERGYVPLPLVRHGIRRLLRSRLREEHSRYGEDRERALDGWVARMRLAPAAPAAPAAPLAERANEQHYGLPPRFFELVLGPRLKYSCALYERGDETLAQAEDAMLALTAERAGLADGQDVLELGCGWGSLTLWAAERFPRSRVLAVTDSEAQRIFILNRARCLGLDNLEVVTADVSEFHPRRRFDRVVSVEMFEHVRNWEELFARIAGWLRPYGRLFLHFFAHRTYAYPYEARGPSDWMARHFFSGGMMPCHDLLDHLEIPFATEGRWAVSGTHYARTAQHWLTNLERRREAVLEVLREGGGAGEAARACQRWRLFFLACTELFGYRGGSEWGVSHQLLRPTSG